MTYFNTDPQALMREELTSAGVAPTGSVSAWPRERNEELMKKFQELIEGHSRRGNIPGESLKGELKTSYAEMAVGLVKAGAQAIRHGRISEEIRNERYDTCKKCPFFLQDSKRCSECGCFMEAKTWIGGDPDQLCPKKKWSR